jgi:MFS family permease
MYVDFWATLFSGAEALLPAFAVAILGLGPRGLGILAASTGAGALLAAAFLAWMPAIHRQGRTVIFMIGCYGLFTVTFGLAPNLWIASLSLALVGASDMVSTVLRQTIRQLATPDAMRGRMNATCSLFHISGPQLGDVEAGAVAAIAGERFSIALGGGLCLVVAGLWSKANALTEYVHRTDRELETAIVTETSAEPPATLSNSSPPPSH